jgi:hypothetical protein
MSFPDWLTRDCISNNVFSSCLKLARVVPVLKSGIQLVLNNYRPVSILNIFSQIFEHILHIGLQKYIDARSVINGNLYGFVHSSNTSLATTSLMSFVREKLDAGLFVVGLFIDLRKAFDCVDRNLLTVAKDVQRGNRGRSTVFVQE